MEQFLTIVIFFILGYIIGKILFIIFINRKKIKKSIKKSIKKQYLESFSKKEDSRIMMDDEMARYKNRTKTTPNFYD